MELNLQAILTGTLPIFLGTLSLLGMMFWAAFQQNQRFEAMNQRLSRIEDQLDKLVSLSAEHNTRIAVIQTKIDGPKLIGAR